jgi:hypothetical protein
LTLSRASLLSASDGAAKPSDGIADAQNDGAACVRLDKGELPDCVETEKGDWYACNEPPEDDGSMQCFQLEDLPECEEGQSNDVPKLNDKKSWVCIDGASYNSDKALSPEDSY